MIYIVTMVKYQVLIHTLIYVFSIHSDLTLILKVFSQYITTNMLMRGSFSELTRAFSQGQTSFSITKRSN